MPIFVKAWVSDAEVKVIHAGEGHGYIYPINVGPPRTLSPSVRHQIGSDGKHSPEYFDDDARLFAEQLAPSRGQDRLIMSGQYRKFNLIETLAITQSIIEIPIHYSPRSSENLFLLLSHYKSTIGMSM